MPQVEKITYDEIVAQNVVINKKFILIDSSLYTAEAYSYLLSLVDKAESIAFIYDTQKIYTQGKYYGGDIWQSKLNYFGNFALLDKNDSIYHTIKPEKSSDTLRLKGENNIKIYSDEVYDSNAAELIKTLKIGFDFASSVDDSTFSIGNKEYSLSINDEGKLYLPANFYIWATMNSADQGVSPMDTAFKRRWEFEYLSINEGEEKAVSVAVNLGLSGIENEELLEWNPVRHRINKALEKARVPEDKWLGPFFINLESLQNPERFIKVFKSKVLMYLFEDAAKYVMPEIFGKEYKSYSELLVDFEKRGTAIFKGE